MKYRIAIDIECNDVPIVMVQHYIETLLVAGESEAMDGAIDRLLDMLCDEGDMPEWAVASMEKL